MTQGLSPVSVSIAAVGTLIIIALSSLFFILVLQEE